MLCQNTKNIFNNRDGSDTLAHFEHFDSHSLQHDHKKGALLACDWSKDRNCWGIEAEGGSGLEDTCCRHWDQHIQLEVVHMEDGHGMGAAAFHTCCALDLVAGEDMHRGRTEVEGSSWEAQDNAHKGMVRYLEASFLHNQHYWGKDSQLQLPGIPPQSPLAACKRKGVGA